MHFRNYSMAGATLPRSLCFGFFRALGVGVRAACHDSRGGAIADVRDSSRQSEVRRLRRAARQRVPRRTAVHRRYAESRRYPASRSRKCTNG
jgi:hypothetical protein